MEPLKKYPSAADIAEMKARGFDRSIIDEAELRRARREPAERVIKVIEKAFAEVSLGAGVGLQEAQAIDDYADAATRAAYRANDEKEDWHRIPAEGLNKCNSSLSFFDAEGMRFHLPAYLIATLRGDFIHEMAFCLTHLCDHSMAQFSLLSPEQRQAVRVFLLHIVDDPDYEFDRAQIVRTLEDYWK